MHTAHSFNIWRSIDRLKLDYCIDPEVILKGTSLKKGSEINALELMQIAQNLNTDSKSLLEGCIDLETLANHLNGDTLNLPEKYSKGMFSSSTSLKNTVNQFKRFGMKDHILKKLQISESYLDEHRPLSVVAVNDALMEAEEFLTDTDLKNYSKANAKDFFDSDFGKYVTKNMSKENLIDTIFSSVHLVEQNWNYKITSKDPLGKYIISTRQSEQMNDLNSAQIYTTPAINKMRIYFFHYFLELCGQKNYKLEILSEQFDSNSKMDFSIQL